jgi:hypothetical protein
MNTKILKFVKCITYYNINQSLCRIVKSQVFIKKLKIITTKVSKESETGERGS